MTWKEEIERQLRTGRAYVFTTLPASVAELALKVSTWLDPGAELSPPHLICAQCGITLSYDFLVPTAQWNALVPLALREKVLCAGCFHILACNPDRSGA